MSARIFLIRVLSVVLFSSCMSVGAGALAEPPKAATKSEELFASLPKDSWPKGGKDGAPERKAAELWMKKNLVGTQIEWTATITEVRAESDGDTIRLSLALDTTAYAGYGGLYGFLPWPTTKAFGDDLRVLVHPNQQVTSFKGYGFLYGRLSPEEAKTIRALNGKKVKVRTSIREVHCEFDTLRKLDSRFNSEPPKNSKSSVVVILTVNAPILNDVVDSARAAEPKDDGYSKLRKLMPKKQLEIVDQIDALHELKESANLESNGLKKREILQKWRSDSKKLNNDVAKLITREGCKNWVAVFNSSGPSKLDALVANNVTSLRISLTFRGLDEKSKEVVRSLKQGDVIRFTVAPDPKANFVVFSITFNGSKIVSIEKIPVE